MDAIRDSVRISDFNESINAKEVIDWVIECCASDQSRDQLFLKRVIAMNADSLGVKRSERPFNTHKKITEKLIKEMFGLSDHQIRELSTEGMLALGPKMIRVFVESAQIVDNKSGKQCNPFFKLYLKTYCKDNRLVFASKPFISKPMIKTSNPKWGTNLDIEVPDSVTDLSDQIMAKVYRHDIVLEIWSKSARISCFERILNRFICYELDDYLGSASLTIGKRSSLENFFTYHIPSTPSFHKLSLSEESESSVSIKTVWGRSWTQRQHQSFLKDHIVLYVRSFDWHLAHLVSDVSEANRTALSESMRSEDLTVLTFLLMPALSLLNQHKVQSNLSTYEDSILRRTVLTNLMLKYSISSDENPIYCLVLAKMLANEEIERKAFTAWLSKPFIQTLNQIERHFVQQLIEHTKNELHLLTKPVDGENSGHSLPLRRLLYHLKALRKYHRKYRELNIKRTINALIGQRIVDWIRKNTEFKSRSKIITFGTVLAQHLRDYWYRLEVIVNYEEVRTILIEWRKSIDGLVSQWKEDKHNQTLCEDILEFFLFLTQVNQIFTKDVENSELETIDTTETSVDERECGLQRQIKPIEKRLKQIRVKDITKRQQKEIKLNGLKFSQFLKAKESESRLFWKGFDCDIFDDWIEKRRQSLAVFANQLVQRYKTAIEDSSEQIRQLIDGRIATKFFFNSMSQLMYFSLSVRAKHDWNYSKFADVLQKLCILCYQFCDQIKDKICLESDESQPNFLALTVFGLNTLEIMQRNHLRTDLIQVITDVEASHLTEIIKQNHKMSPTVDRSTDQSEDGFESWSRVAECCRYIHRVANDIQQMQVLVCDHVSDQMAKKAYNQLTNIISHFDDHSLRVCESNADTIDSFVDKAFSIISENVIQKQSICFILLKTKAKTEKVFVNQLEHILRLFKQIENQSERGIEAKLIRVIKLFKFLSKIYENLTEKMSNFVLRLRIDDKFSKYKYRNVESIDDMIGYMHNSIKGKQ